MAHIAHPRGPPVGATWHLFTDTLVAEDFATVAAVVLRVGRGWLVVHHRQFNSNQYFILSGVTQEIKHTKCLAATATAKHVTSIVAFTFWRTHDIAHTFLRPMGENLCLQLLHSSWSSSCCHRTCETYS